MKINAVKIILLTSFFLIFGGMMFFFAPETVLTQTGYSAQTNAFVEGAGFEAVPRDPREVVARILEYVLSFLGVILLGYLIYGGYMIMTSGGNEEKIGKGKKTIFTAVIGLAIITSAYALTKFVFMVVSGEEAPTNGVNIEVQPDESVLNDPYADRTDPAFCIGIFCQ